MTMLANRPPSSHPASVRISPPMGVSLALPLDADRRARRAAREKQGSGADQGEKRRGAACGGHGVILA